MLTFSPRNRRQHPTLWTPKFGKCFSSEPLITWNHNAAKGLSRRSSSCILTTTSEDSLDIVNAPDQMLLFHISLNLDFIYSHPTWNSTKFQNFDSWLSIYSLFTMGHYIGGHSSLKAEMGQYIAEITCIHCESLSLVAWNTKLKLSIYVLQKNQMNIVILLHILLNTFVSIKDFIIGISAKTNSYRYILCFKQLLWHNNKSF